jgi:hypothetical protein
MRMPFDTSVPDTPPPFDPPIALVAEAVAAELSESQALCEWLLDRRTAPAGSAAQEAQR